MKVFNDDYYASRKIYVSNHRKRYGFFNFVFDCIMVMITAGFWLIWIFAREMRKR